jgi:hypothetical protein
MKFVPLIVSINEFGLATTDDGEMLVIADPTTTSCWGFEVTPDSPFCTYTL